ncbi:uncharacterized protein LOC125522926 isoform X2 [Triticum urartu]|uniref:uncharacterized protein LOC125508794 isoform X2 n=1 Tax=Triticum urartu TaxID=4572 RepID=UPI0020446FD2|nr:uncharacterized protein LOC125508794 isoform X2 [Triticum urartu]XP_048543924.1 uncharacterized protein LOC125522926 isoform X2 [Triticum urartu]
MLLHVVAGTSVCVLLVLGADVVAPDRKGRRGAAAGYGGGPLMELGADAEAMGPTLCVQIMMTWSTVMGSFYSSLPIFIGLGSIGRLKTMYPFPVWIPTIAFSSQGGGRCQWKTWLHMKVHSPIVFKKMRRSWF